MIACDDLVDSDASILARRWGVPRLKTHDRQFASTGEWSTWAIPPSGSRRVLLVASLRPDVHLGLFRVMLAAAGLRSAGDRKVDLLVPMLPYARSDLREQPTAAVGRDVFLSALVHAGVDQVWTLDAHASPQTEPPRYLQSIPTHQMLLGETRRHLPEIDTILLPDQGAATRLGAHVADFRLVVLDKCRDSDSMVRVRLLCDNIPSGRTLILDDALFTGATHAAAAVLARQHGASDVHLAVSHALPDAHALGRLKDAGVETLIHLGTSLAPVAHSGLRILLTNWSESVPMELRHTDNIN